VSDRGYRVEFKPSAAKAVRKLPVAVQRRILDRVEALAGDPRPQGCDKLEGLRDLYRVRVGQYRVVYQVSDKLLLVLVVRVAHRREVYR